MMKQQMKKNLVSLLKHKKNSTEINLWIVFVSSIEFIYLILARVKSGLYLHNINYHD